MSWILVRQLIAPESRAAKTAWTCITRSMHHAPGRRTTKSYIPSLALCIRTRWVAQLPSPPKPKDVVSPIGGRQRWLQSSRKRHPWLQRIHHLGKQETLATWSPEPQTKDPIIPLNKQLFPLDPARAERVVSPSSHHLPRTVANWPKIRGEGPCRGDKQG